MSMDTKNIIAQSRARFAHEANKRMLKEKYEAKMLFAHKGGMWRAGPELQTTLLTCPDEEVVILDLYENPVKVNTKELLAMSQRRWQEQMNAWYIEFEQARQNR